MRHFIDSAGVEWTVFEVKRGETQAKWSYLPDEFGDGWLCFESRFIKRRLTVVPKGWREASDVDLERMMKQARPSARGKAAEGELRD
jgi:hypothetical protein